MKVNVEMSFPRVIFTGKERKGGFPLNSSFSFSVDDDKCPLCGKQLNDAKCSCKKFNIALSRLQKALGDKEHVSHIQTYGLAWAGSFFDMAYEKANKSRLPYDLFDSAFRTKDIFTGETYFVSKGESDDGKTIVFYLKTLSDKKVYKVTAVMKDEKNRLNYPTVKLVVTSRRFTQGVPGVYGSSLPFWEDEAIKTFSYQDFLEALRQYK